MFQLQFQYECIVIKRSKENKKVLYLRHTSLQVDKQLVENHPQLNSLFLQRSWLDNIYLTLGNRFRWRTSEVPDDKS